MHQQQVVRLRRTTYLLCYNIHDEKSIAVIAHKVNRCIPVIVTEIFFKTLGREQGNTVAVRKRS